MQVVNGGCDVSWDPWVLRFPVPQEISCGHSWLCGYSRGCGFPTVHCHNDLLPSPFPCWNCSKSSRGNCLDDHRIVWFPVACGWDKAPTRASWMSGPSLGGVFLGSSLCTRRLPLTIQGHCTVAIVNSHCFLNTSCPFVASCLHLDHEGCWPRTLLSVTHRNPTSLLHLAQTSHLPLNEPFLSLFLHYLPCSHEAVTNHPPPRSCCHVFVSAGPCGRGTSASRSWRDTSVSLVPALFPP